MSCIIMLNARCVYEYCRAYNIIKELGVVFTLCHTKLFVGYIVSVYNEFVCRHDNILFIVAICSIIHADPMHGGVGRDSINAPELY